MAGFHVEHFGCRAARADGEAVGSHLHAAGLNERHPSEADLVIVNTCSVTAEADRAARAFIRRTHRRNPKAKIVVTGCYAQRAPQELAGLSGVAAVIGNSHKALAPEIIFGLAQATTETAPLPPSFIPVQSLLSATPPSTAPIWADELFAHSFIEDTRLSEPHLIPGRQTRPNLKIQDGCGNRCTFCVIPQTRGPSQSVPAASVMRQIQSFVAAGGKELVLSGINLGRWGGFSSGSGREALAGLVRAILEQSGLPRLRLSSIEPMDWDDDLIALMRAHGGGRLARHAHLPLQSGSDAVLRRMHRRYRPWHYAEKVAALLRAAGPDLTLGADVMVGFPGETDREFEETLSFIRLLPFGYLHLFPFSPRPGTRAWALHAASPVPQTVVDERMAALSALAAEKTHAHRARFIDRDLSAITLHTPPALAARSRTVALTENFLPVELAASLAANQLVSVRVSGLSPEATLHARENVAVPPKPFVHHGQANAILSLR
jgi:threonylcarbamoyladenosine tRNA methylthiotransferase MtaB